MYIQVIRRNDSLGGQAAQAEDPAEQWTEEQLLASDTIRKQDFVVVHTRRKKSKRPTGIWSAAGIIAR